MSNEETEKRIDKIEVELLTIVDIMSSFAKESVESRILERLENL